MPNSPSLFIVLTTQRSGSGWLTDMLARHSAVRMFPEVFLDTPRANASLNSDLLPELRFREYRQVNGRMRPWITFRYVDQLLLGGAGCSAVGFKLMYGQLLQLPELGAKLLLERCRVIHLIRENALDVVVSGELMRSQNRVHTSVDLGPARVRLDIDSLLRALRRHVRRVSLIRRALRLSGLPVLPMTYEMLAADTGSQLARIADFLRLPSGWSDSGSRHVRVNRGLHREKISNYAEVAAALADSPYRRFLE